MQINLFWAEKPPSRDVIWFISMDVVIFFAVWNGLIYSFESANERRFVVGERVH